MNEDKESPYRVIMIGVGSSSRLGCDLVEARIGPEGD